MSQRDFLRRVWRLENDERPAFQFNVQVNSDTSMLERFNDVDKMMRHQLAEILLKTGIVDDSVPAFFPYMGTAIFPSAFGCPVRWFEQQDPWALPVIKSNAQAVYDLPDPSVTDGDLGRVLEYTRVMSSSQQALPIRMTDMQGPLDVASLIWGEEDFMVAMYEHPAEVHHLMEKVTRLLIAFVQEQRRIVHMAGREFIPCHYPPIWMPDGQGIAISDDMLSLMSPRLYAEFALPYVNKLSDAFGGIFIHSCGNFKHNLPNLKTIHNLRGVDFAVSETPFEDVSQALAGKAVLSVRLGLNKDIRFDTIPAWVEHVLRAQHTVQGLFLVINLWYSLPGSGKPLVEGDVERIAVSIRQTTARQPAA